MFYQNLLGNEDNFYAGCSVQELQSIINFKLTDAPKALLLEPVTETEV